MKDKVALIDGASGFIGHHAVIKMHEEGYEIVAVSRDHKEKAFPKDVVRAYGDLRNLDFTNRLISEYEPDVVLHIAAVAIVSQAQVNPSETFTSNVIGTLNLLESCKRMSKKKIWFLNFGTDKQLGNGYDKKEDSPYPNLTELGPYELSKAYAEILTQRYSEEFETCSTRCANIYGPGDTHSRIIPNLIREVLSLQDPKVFIEEPPSTRQYIYTRDVVDAIATLVKFRAKGIYHIGTPFVLTQEQVAQTILDQASRIDQIYSNLEIRHVRDEAKRKSYLWYILNQSLNYEKIKRDFGWEPKWDIQHGIYQTIRWFLEKEKEKEDKEKIAIKKAISRLSPMHD